MFYRDKAIVRSSLLDGMGIPHGFATRGGGVSVIPQTASMNLAPLMGDSEENVRENIARLAAFAGLGDRPVIYGRQLHSVEVLDVDADTPSGGTCGRECDGYFTSDDRVALLVRSADCVPILFAGMSADGGLAVAAVHAGWRGTVAGIAAVAVERLSSHGVHPSRICAAIGPSIHDCCFEVREDFTSAVAAARGGEFASRHIHERGGKLYASLQSMNLEILESAGVASDKIDISPDCTAHNPDVYHSHRASGGRRGVGGAVIGLPRLRKK